MAEKEIKANRNTSNNFLVSTYDNSSIKKVMSNQEVSRFNGAKQRQRNVQKSVLHVQICLFVCLFVCFLLIIDLLPYHCRRRLVLHDFFLLLFFCL